MIARGLFRRSTPLDAEADGRLQQWRRLPRIDRRTPLVRARWVILDLETSGLDVRHDQPLAAGALALEGLKLETGRLFEVVLRHAGAVPADNIVIHGLSPTVLAGGADPVAGLLALLEYAGKSPLVAFHAAFDRQILQRALRRHLRLRLPNLWLDLASLAPALVPEAPLAKRAGATLDDWLAYFGLQAYARHRAAADALATGELFLILLQRAQARGHREMRELLDLADAQARAPRGLGA